MTTSTENFTRQPILLSGQFVRVASNHPNTYRAGKDGMVVPGGDMGNSVGLVFWFDRHNTPQRTQCVGPELWDKQELDMATIDG